MWKRKEQDFGIIGFPGSGVNVEEKGTGFWDYGIARIRGDKVVEVKGTGFWDYRIARIWG